MVQRGEDPHVPRLERAETPHEAFMRKMPLKGTVVDEGGGGVYRVDKG